MAQAKVVFTKHLAGRYAVHAHRPDGAVVAMPSSDRKFRVPHDLAHFVVERELKLPDGVFGTVMSGGQFQKMRIVSGSRRYDDGARGAAVVRANSSSRALTLAEVLAGVVHHAVETGEKQDLFGQAREQWGILRETPFPYRRAMTADVGGSSGRS